MINKTVVIFGVFDGIHDGHSSFIKDAKKQGNHLVAIVARDSMVLELKGKSPKYNEVDRINNLLESQDVDLVLLGDPTIGVYNILKEVKPDVVFLGYDQQALCDNLSDTIKNGKLPEMEIIRGKPYNGDVLHSSILNNK